MNAALREVLEESRERGFLGPSPIEQQVRHARGFASWVARAPESFLDLGSGGGLPGLVLAVEWPSTDGVLLEAMERRAEFLVDACDRLQFGRRIQVVCERAEVAGRDGRYRGRFDLVVARSFGRPAVTAECAAPFLHPSGTIVVSEPPEDDSTRWPAEGLARLGLQLERAPSEAGRFVTLRAGRAAEDRWPRRTGVPAKRPLWGGSAPRST